MQQRISPTFLRGQLLDRVILARCLEELDNIDFLIEKNIYYIIILTYPLTIMHYGCVIIRYAKRIAILFGEFFKIVFLARRDVISYNGDIVVPISSGLLVVQSYRMT